MFDPTSYKKMSTIITYLNAPISKENLRKCRMI